MTNFQEINEVIELYFRQNNSKIAIMAKDLMPKFIESGIFEKDHRSGLPIRNILRELARKNDLHKIPSTFAIRKNKNTDWFFINLRQVFRDSGYRL